MTSDNSGDVVVVDSVVVGAETNESDRRLSGLGGLIGVLEHTIVR